MPNFSIFLFVYFTDIVYIFRKTHPTVRMADNTPTPVVTVTSENTDKEDRPPIITEKMDIDGTESAPKVEKEDTPTESKENMEVETAGNVPIKDEEDETKEDGAVGGNGEASTSQGKKGEDIDLYAYTKGDKFTSEIYKIEVLNLPIRVGFGVGISDNP